MKKLILFLYFFNFILLKSQTLYFPPTTGNSWDTLSPSSLGWCPERIDSLYNYLGAHNTDGFIILKNGKIVLEKYFGTFTVDSVHVWNSAGKSLTAMLTGIAIDAGLFSINDTVSDILGNGWTSCSTNQERQITIRNLLTMTSGLNDLPTGGSCDNDAVTPACLQYLTTSGTRWAYHTGAYRKLEDIISTAAGANYTAVTTAKIGNITGMQGAWINYNFFSRTRDMARFGLLTLNKGIWANDTILHDTTYFNEMINTSQNFNQSYGYLWWLNGKQSYMMPGSQSVYTNSFLSNGASDMICALGKNDQKIYVVPSLDMVVVRNGGSAYGVASAFSPFDNELWGYIDSLDCTTTRITTHVLNDKPVVYPNPFISRIHIKNVPGDTQFTLINILGQQVWSGTQIEQTDFSYLQTGIYFLKINAKDDSFSYRLTKQ